MLPDLKKFYEPGAGIPLSERPPGCLGCQHPAPRVGSRGPKDSPLVIVGESPGKNELTKGYPFIGDSGELIHETLKRLGWEDSDPEPLFLNALQCLPRNKNDMGVLPAAVSTCQHRLLAEINQYPRRLVIAMGNGAIWGTTNNFKLKSTQDRGKLYNLPGSELGCLITMHPAYLLRTGNAYAHWKRDLDYAIALFKGTDPKEGLWAPPKWSVVTNRQEYEALVTRLSTASLTTGDIETGGAFGAGLDYRRGYIISLGVTSSLSNGREVDIIPSEALWECEDLTRFLLGNPSTKWNWQNGKFDIKFFRHEGIMEARVDEDTMLASYCLNENKGHDLDTIAWDWIGAPKHKNAIEDWFHAAGIPKKRWDYGLVPKDILYRYQAYDISKTHQCISTLKEAIEADPACDRLYHKTLIPASEFLTQMEMAGLTLDLDRIQENDEFYAREIAEEDAEIQKFAVKYLGRQINVGSYQQLGDLLYGAMKLGVGPSTDDDALTTIQRRHDHPIVNYVRRWRTASKARNTYVKNAPSWLSSDGRVHCSFKLHGTTTGRLSSGQPTNLQNWPRLPQVRGAFVAAQGKVFTSTDLNQAELRCLAIMSGDPTLIAIYTDPNAPSIHHITSEALFGAGYTDEEKMRGKAVNFGIVYGRTAQSFAEEFNVSWAEGADYIKAWLARFPVAAKFIQACRDAPTLQRNLVTSFGRKKRWGVVSRENIVPSENEAANFPHQSTAHDITLHAGIETQPVLRKLWDAYYVNEIHDDIMGEMWNDPNVYGPALAYVQAVMQRKPVQWGLTKVPFIAECKIGVRWGAKKNAREAGETDPLKLAEYMTDFTPTDAHREAARKMLWDNGLVDVTVPPIVKLV